jgi:hypothetical protein
MVSFRPTPAQALGRGAFVGGVVGLGLCVLTIVAWAARGEDVQGWLAGVPVFSGVTAGGLVALIFGRQDGADIDDHGIHPVRPGPPGPHDGAFTSWRRVNDLRCERRRGRTQVVVYLDTGQTAWLRAPYHGRLLASDPGFERKLFMLRNLWETHRTFAIEHDHPRAHSR